MRQIKSSLILATSAVFIVASAVRAIAAEPIKLVSIESGINNQILSVVILEVYRRAGIDVEITPLPAQRAKRRVMAGLADGEVARVAAYGNDRDDLIRVEPPINTLQTAAFVRKDSSIQIDRPDDLKIYTVGVVRRIVHAENVARHAATVVYAGDIELLCSAVYCFCDLRYMLGG